MKLSAIHPTKKNKNQTMGKNILILVWVPYFNGGTLETFASLSWVFTDFGEMKVC